MRARTFFCLPCTKAGCHRWFKNKSGLTQHLNACHPDLPHIKVSDLAQQEQGQDQQSLWDEEQFQPLPDDYDDDPFCTDFIGQGDMYYRNYHLRLTGV